MKRGIKILKKRSADAAKCFNLTNVFNNNITDASSRQNIDASYSDNITSPLVLNEEEEEESLDIG